jgi:hypothetical protein
MIGLSKGISKAHGLKALSWRVYEKIRPLSCLSTKLDGLAILTVPLLLVPQRHVGYCFGKLNLKEDSV